MKDISYIFRRNWLKIPQFIYNILLFGSWIVLIVSTFMIIRGFVRKKGKKYFISWIVALLVALAISVLTMTGKIAGHMMFGG